MCIYVYSYNMWNSKLFPDPLLAQVAHYTPPPPPPSFYMFSLCHCYSIAVLHLDC